MTRHLGESATVDLTRRQVGAARVIQPQLLNEYRRLIAAEGVEVVDDSGRRLLDAAAGVGVMSLGYTVPEIVEAMTRQAQQLPYAHAMRFGIDAAQELANELGLVSPPEIRNFFFCSGGSEATETALKIARQYYLEIAEPTRFRFIGRWQSFHGNTLASQSIGGHLARRRRHLPLLIEFPHVEAPNCYRDHPGRGHEDCATRYSSLLRTAIERAGPETVAGFMMETVTGATSGALIPPPGYLDMVREICDKYGVLLILDEVFTAVGRTGRNYAFEHWGVVPDLVTMGKGIGGGFTPVGAVGVSGHVLEAFERGSGLLEHNFTFASHPVACVAAATALRLIRERDLTHAAEIRGNQLVRSLDPLLERATVGDVRGLGLLIGVEFVADRNGGVPFAPEVGFGAQVAEACYSRGLIVYPGTGTLDGFRGDHILLCPPFIITDNDVVRIATILVQAVTAVEANLSDT